jgi:hypothetical protein
MDTDDWLKTIEKKLQVIQCNNCQKALFSSHQLESFIPREARKHQLARVQE